MIGVLVIVWGAVIDWFSGERGWSFAELALAWFVGIVAIMAVLS